MASSPPPNVLLESILLLYGRSYLESNTIKSKCKGRRKWMWLIAFWVTVGTNCCGRGMPEHTRKKSNLEKGEYECIWGSDSRWGLCVWVRTRACVGWECTWILIRLTFPHGRHSGGPHRQASGLMNVCEPYFFFRFLFRVPVSKRVG